MSGNFRTAHLLKNKSIVRVTGSLRKGPGDLKADS